MPFTITKLTADEAKVEFKRRGSNVEKLDSSYVDNLRSLSVGEGFTVRVQEVTRDGKFIEVVPDTADGEGNADTVRAFKRRMSAAANSLELKLKWKPKGHREGDGDNSRFVTDWLSGLILANGAKTVKNGSTGK